MPARRFAGNGSDPSTDGSVIAYHQPGATGVLIVDGRPAPLGGVHPAVGGARLGYISGDAIVVQQTSGAPFSLTVPAPGADAIAVSATWLAWRVREGDADALYALPLAGGEPRLVARAGELGRPDLGGDLLAFHAPAQAGTRILIADLGTGRTRVVRSERRALLLNPSLHGGRLVYVRAVYSRQELRLGPLRRRAPRRDARLWSTVPTGRRDAGHEPGERHKRHGHPHRLWRRPRRGLAATLWTTALAADAAYVTRLRQVAGKALHTDIMRVPR